MKEGRKGKRWERLNEGSPQERKKKGEKGQDRRKAGGKE